MTLPDYNASPDKLYAFLTDLQEKYNTEDVRDMAIYYDLFAWLAVVKYRFNEGDRKRLFIYLNSIADRK